MKMLDSFVRLRRALVKTLDELIDPPPTELTRRDWDLIELVVKVLKPFEEATLELSKQDASISCVIPLVSSIKESLEVKPREDKGVIGMKRALKNDMETRFAGIEENDHYAIATLLDARYKECFFKDADTLPRIKGVIIDKLVNSLREAAPTEVIKYSYMVNKIGHASV